MMNLPEKTIKDTIWINANPTTVFRALTESRELVKWFPDAEAKITPEIGGDVLFKWADGGVLKSKVRSFVPNEELSYGFYGGEDEPVTFKLSCEKSGTRLNLSHFIPAGGDLEMFIGIASNWSHLLVGLKCWVEKEWDIRLVQ